MYVIYYERKIGLIHNLAKRVLINNKQKKVKKKIFYYFTLKMNWGFYE